MKFVQLIEMFHFVRFRSIDTSAYVFVTNDIQK